MLAVIYLIVMIMLGDTICRRFYPFVSLPHRLAAAFLTGLLFSSWATYLLGLLFAGSAQPLLWGNLIYFVSAAGVILWLRRRKPLAEKDAYLPASENKANRWDWFLIGFFIIFASWQMFGTFNMSDGKLQIHHHLWSDFGPNVAISQSFALGHNFPTEYPHFSGERIHYHFLYYFQIGNLVYLGLNPTLSNNILSILSLVSMLILVMSLGVVLFNSKAVGRIAAILFFFHGTLSFIPFIFSHHSVSGFINEILTMRNFLASGFPYRGEDWGIWSQVVFVNQRHFASSIGLLLLVLMFLLISYRAASTNKPDEDEKSDDSVQTNWLRQNAIKYAPFIFSGVLLGLSPLWNTATFVSAFAILALLFFLFPLKKQMTALGVITAVFALPQIIFLRGGNLRPAGYSLFHWGYIIEDPTLWNVVKYLGFTFGFKWILLALAVYFATWFERRVFIAVSGLFALTFFFKFSIEVLTNHKFLNIWLVIVNVFVAYSLWRLWNSENWLKSKLFGKVCAFVLFVLITFSGIIDLFPLRNGNWIEITYQNDPLINWLKDETNPKAVFLTPRYINHHIFLAGRRVFYGHPYYAWGAGYRTDERDIVYRNLFETQDPKELIKLLTENNISYVVIDNSLRDGSFTQKLNESLYEQHFDKVFTDYEKKYGSLTIYEIPSNLRELNFDNISWSEPISSN
jgi:hypothetical protein